MTIRVLNEQIETDFSAAVGETWGFLVEIHQSELSEASPKFLSPQH